MEDRDRSVLEAILEHARMATAYASRHGANWVSRDETLDAILMRLAQVGELAKRLSAEEQMALSTVDWRSVKAMRERIVHDYVGIDRVIVRQVITEEVPGLIAAVERRLGGR